MNMARPEFLKAPQVFRDFKKAIHPKVLNVLESLRAPSPAKVPRDNYQPKTGNLREKVSIPYIIEPISLLQSNSTTKPNEPTLSLSSNKLLNRRRVTQLG